MDPSSHPIVPRRWHRLAGAVATMVVASWPLAALGSPSVVWSQAQGGPTHAGYVADAPASPFKASWHLAIPLSGAASSFGVSAPVVTGSTVISVAPTQIVAADSVSGAQLWTVDRDFGPTVPPAIATGGDRELLIYTEGFGDSPPGSSPSASTAPSSPSPTATSSGSFDSHVAAIDLATHEPVWKAPLDLKEVSRTGVTVSGDTAYVGDNRGNVYAVDVATGKLRWTEALGGFLTVPFAATDDEVIATVQASRTVRPRIVALRSTDGSQRWSTEIQASAAFVTTPSVDGDQVIVGLSDQTVRSFGLDDGAERWVTRLNGPMFFTGGVSVTPDAIVTVDSLGDVYRLDPQTGARVWVFAWNQAVLRSPPVVAGSSVLIATGDGRLGTVDLETGRLTWQSDPSGSVLRSITPLANVVVAVQGGLNSGLVGFVTDPSGSLVSIVSPTELNLGTLFGAFLLAAIPLAALLLLGGRALLARMGPAFLDEGDTTVSDPWEDPDPDGETAT